jgi:hypothetical protein
VHSPRRRPMPARTPAACSPAAVSARASGLLGRVGQGTGTCPRSHQPPGPTCRPHPRPASLSARTHRILHGPPRLASRLHHPHLNVGALPANPFLGNIARTWNDHAAHAPSAGCHAGPPAGTTWACCRREWRVGRTARSFSHPLPFAFHASAARECSPRGARMQRAGSEPESTAR